MTSITNELFSEELNLLLQGANSDRRGVGGTWRDIVAGFR